MKKNSKESTKQLKSSLKSKKISKQLVASKRIKTTSLLLPQNKYENRRPPSKRLSRADKPKIRTLAKSRCKIFAAKVSNKNSDKKGSKQIGKRHLMKREKLNTDKKSKNTMAKKIKKIRKTIPMSIRRSSAAAALNSHQSLEVPIGKDPISGSTVKGKKVSQAKTVPAYKKKSAASPFIAICEYFLSEANDSSFHKLIQFYEQDLKEPLFALMLKKFFIKFKGTEKYKENLELRKFFYRLRFCRGVTEIMKASTQKTSKETEASK